MVLQRLKALDDGWEDVQKMWENKQQQLSQSLNLQVSSSTLLLTAVLYTWCMSAASYTCVLHILATASV